MAEEGEQEIPIEPEDPEFEVQQHIRFRRRQEVLNASLNKLLEKNLSEFRPTMQGTTYVYTQLSLKNQGISEIPDVIQEYKHLRNIDLSLNQLQDIPNLLNLNFLTHLNLSKNILTSVNFLSRESVFPYLKVLNLSGNKIDRVPLIASKNLRMINLNHNVIKNLEQFEGHPLIEIIELRGNKLTNFIGLGNLPNLRELYAAENELQSLKGIKNCEKLAKIHARKNKIASLSEYPEISSVLYLNLRENTIAKVDDLTGVSDSIKILNLLATPLEGQLADNAKKQIWMKFRNFEKINKVEITGEQKEEYDKQYKDRLAEQERERLEKEAAEKAEREAAENPDGEK